MMSMPDHAKPSARKDHLWVLVIIAACALAEVWGSWVGIGSISGFPKFGRMSTDWVLAVVMEAYWAYGLYAWLAASPGPKSRSFAMWSCAVIFVLSLVGQVAYHELTIPPGTPIGRRVIAGFVTVLPVTVLALVAVLIHLRHADRAEAAAEAESTQKAERQAALERAEADDRTALRTEVGTLVAELGSVREDLADARREAEAATRRAEATARKLEAATGSGKGGNGTRKPAAATGRKASVPAPEIPAVDPDDLPGNWDELDSEARVLFLVDAGLSASKAGLAAGVTDARGRQIARAAKRLTETAPQEAVVDATDA
jgi:hypothetical protein